MLYILQILKEIREEHDRRSDHSTALTPVQLETLVSDTGVGVEAEPELMQVKCTSLHFFVFFFRLSHSVPLFFLRWTILLQMCHWNNLIYS